VDSISPLDRFIYLNIYITESNKKQQSASTDTSPINNYTETPVNFVNDKNLWGNGING
jgi:hypothetical protein